MRSGSYSGVFNRLNRNERLRAAAPYNNTNSRNISSTTRRSSATDTRNTAKIKNEKPIEFALLSSKDEDEDTMTIKWDSVVANGIIMATESDLEAVIRSKIKDSLKGSFPLLGPNDFDFVKVRRKQISNMSLVLGMEYSYAVVKKLAGQGIKCIYK